ncbi:MAG TPA: glycosyltransferase family 4 protein [Phycisphaerae bacterium]|nr:glycosyltransferase family 4 protein [Phycisphaerae bacterium]HRW53927.1 glycosyltransferase family 4 protein [Phycisphaerae bacterium]
MKLLWHMPTLRRVSCGLSIRAINFARRLAAVGHDLTFAVARDKTDCHGADIAGLPLIHLDVPPRPPAHWALQSLERVRMARVAVSQLALDVDVLITCQPEAVIAFKERTDRPVVFVCGGTTLLHDAADAKRRRRDTSSLRHLMSAPAYAIDRRLKRRNERRGFSLADACVFDSASTRDRVIAEYAINGDKSHAIRGAVDIDAFRPPTAAERADARAAYGLDDNTMMLAWTGRLSPEKNLETLIRAIPLCRRRQLRLILAGDGPERGRLEELVSAIEARALAVGDDTRTRSVQFLRDVDDVRPLLHAADLFVFPSVSESLGLSLIEAMACNLPAIALRSDGDRVRNAAAEILDDGRCGALVEQNTPEAFAAEIVRLLDSADQRANLALAARRRAVTFFDWTAASRDFESLITHFICRSKGQAKSLSEKGATHEGVSGAFAECASETASV